MAGPVPNALTLWISTSRPYIPGRGPRPHGDDEVHRVARTAPVLTTSANWNLNPAWLAGLELYGAGFYWEAHEVWEPVWMAAHPNSGERILVQATIQLTNAALKQRMGRLSAAVRLADISARLLTDIASPGAKEMGVSISELRQSLTAYRTSLADGDRFARPPQISLHAMDHIG